MIGEVVRQLVRQITSYFGSATTFWYKYINLVGTLGFNIRGCSSSNFHGPLHSAWCPDGFGLLCVNKISWSHTVGSLSVCQRGSIKPRGEIQQQQQQQQEGSHWSWAGIPGSKAWDLRISGFAATDLQPVLLWSNDARSHWCLIGGSVTILMQKHSREYEAKQLPSNGIAVCNVMMPEAISDIWDGILSML